MKSQEPKEKKLRHLSDQELVKVTGGMITHATIMCDEFTNPCQPGTMPNPMNNCQCEPMPNTEHRDR